jgi:hypothetical protein
MDIPTSIIQKRAKRHLSALRSTIVFDLGVLNIAQLNNLIRQPLLETPISRQGHTVSSFHHHGISNTSLLSS